MNPVRLRGFTPDEFERICLELARRIFGASEAIRRGGISDPDQGVDIELRSNSGAIGIQCKSGRVTTAVLRDSLRQLIRYPRRLDRFILMCAQHPVPGALDEFRAWAESAQTVAGPIANAELWDPDRLGAELDPNQDILSSISRAPAAVVFAVPASPLETFVGRREELAQLDTWLQAQPLSQPAISLVGIGGIGKSSLALQFAHSRRSQFSGGVYWLNGQEPLLSQCARFAAMSSSAIAGTSEVAAARTFLHSIRSQSRALIIVDDLDRPNLINEPIVDELSLSKTGASILVTSRFSGLLAGRVSRLALDELSQQEALELLATASRRPSLLDSKSADYPPAVQLCQILGLLPLAIQIAGAFLALNPDATIASYLESLAEYGTVAGIGESEAEALRFHDVRSASIAASLRMAYDAIHDEGARRLFHVLCLLPSKYPVNRAMLPLLLGAPSQADTQVARSVAWLSNSGLIYVDDRGQIVLHLLARSFGQSLLTDQERRDIASSVANSTSQELLRLLDPGTTVLQQAAAKPRVFLCYAGQDRATVDRLFDRLSRDGFSPWMDKRSLLPGQDWKLGIKRAIEASDYFVACISQRFQEKTYANLEVKLALDVLDTMPEGVIFLIPLRLEDCKVQDRLASRQWVDLFDEDGYERLLLALRSQRRD